MPLGVAAVYRLGRQDHPRPARCVWAHDSKHAHAFNDRELSLQKAWTDHPQRLEAAHVPIGIGIATEPQLARTIPTRTPLPEAVADSVYGVGQIETALRSAGQQEFRLGITVTHEFRS